MRKWLCLLLLPFIVFASGCNGAHETDQLAYVVAIGLDKGENNKIVVTYQVAIPRQLSGTGGGSESDNSSGSSEEVQKNFANITIAAFSFAETRNELKSIVTLIPEVNHAKLLVFGEELAKSGLGDVLASIFRLREFRGNMYVAVTKGSAQDFLEKNKPTITSSTAKYYELMMQSATAGFYLSTSLHKFYLGMKHPGSDAYAVYVGVNPQFKAEKLLPDTKKRPAGYKDVPRVAGEINRIGGGAAEFIGTAIFDGDKMVGLLDSCQTRLFSLFLARPLSSYLTIEDIHPAAEKKGISLRFRAVGPPEVKTEIVEGKPIAHIHLKLEGELTSIASGINYEQPEYREQLESRLSDLFTQDLQGLIHHLQECNSDVLSIGDYFRSGFSTFPQFADFDWKGKFKEAQIDGDVQFKIRRAGLLWKTNPIEE